MRGDVLRDAGRLLLKPFVAAVCFFGIALVLAGCTAATPEIQYVPQRIYVKPEARADQLAPCVKPSKDPAATMQSAAADLLAQAEAAFDECAAKHAGLAKLLAP